MSVQQSLRPALRVSVPAYRAAKPKSPTVPINSSRLSLQVVKQIWSSYPVLNISSRTWEARRRSVVDDANSTPHPNALGLDLGLPASGAYTLLPNNFMSDADARLPSLEPGEVPETLPSMTLSPVTATKARALLLESFHHFASSPERTQFVAELEPKLTDELVCDIIRQGPIVLNDLKKAGHGERIEEMKRKFGIMSDSQEASMEQARRIRRRVDAVSHVMPAASDHGLAFDQDMEVAQSDSRPPTPVVSETKTVLDPYAPSIYVAKTGQSAPSVVEVSFELDERTAEAARRSSHRGTEFQAKDPHVRLCLLGLKTTDAQAVIDTSATTGTPIPILVSQLPTVWPPKGTLYVSLNNGMGLWDPTHFSSTSPSVDISHAVQTGLNTIKFISLADISSTIFMVILLPLQDAECRPWAQLDKLRKMTRNSNNNGSIVVDFVPS